MPFYKKAAWVALVLSAVSFCFIMLFESSKVASFPIGWEKSYFITPYDINIKNIKLDQKGNLIALVYEGEKNRTSGIYVSLSFDNGENFLQPVKIAEITSKTDRYPDISISSNGHIAAVWQELTEADPNSRIYYAQSADMGASWSSPEKIKLPTEMEMLPKVFYDDKNRLHVFYTAYNDKGFNLFHIFSENENTFSSPRNLVEITGELRGAFFPAVRVEGSNFYIVWQGKEKKQETLSDNLYFINSSNYGSSWSSKKLVTSSAVKDSAPYIAAYNSDIFLVYQNNEAKNWAIKLIRGTEKGTKWSAPVSVSTTNADCYAPVIAKSNDGNLFVIWYDTRNKIPGVFARKLPQQGQPASAEVMLSRTGVSAKKPLAVSLGRKIMVFWEESGRVMVKNTDVYVDPPLIYSTTHPENTWAKSSRAVIRWTPPRDESNIAGYAVLLKRPDEYNLPDLDPTIPNLEANVTQYTTPDLEDGISYFYIRTVDGAGNFSRTVRYKIQVSKNPLSMPIVNSATHPEGKASDSTNPVLTWKVEDTARLKGFMYAISKNNIAAPEKFTTDMDIKFNNLAEGRYFFSLRSVDKTNTLSPIATYEIIVGKAARLNPEDYVKIAQEIKKIQPETIAIKPVKPKLPSVELNLPFDITTAFEGTSFDAEIKTGNFDKKEIIGYSFYTGKEEKEPQDRITSKSNIINVSGLQDGDYYIGVKARYSQYKKRKKEYLWTDPVIKKFRIELPAKESPLIAFINSIINRLSVNIPASASIIVMILSVFTISFGAKISFYSKLFRMRVGNVFRIFL